MYKISLKNNYQNNIRNDIIEFIKNKNIKPKNIFEFGGGSGFTSEKLCEIFKCNAINLDLNIPELRSLKIDHIEGDINKIDLTKKVNNNKFDLILALDFIEHIDDTEKVMNIIKSISKKNTYLVISVPNVKNFRIPFNIYFKNSFPRKDSGIFDKTHLRWFTKQDIKNLINLNHFKFIDSSYTDHKSLFVKNKFLEKTLGFLIAPQIIVCGKKYKSLK